MLTVCNIAQQTDNDNVLSSSTHFDNPGNHFSQMSDVFLTLGDVNCFPELFNSTDQLVFGTWLDFPPDVLLAHVTDFLLGSDLGTRQVSSTSWRSSRLGNPVHALRYV